jgi:hypothetical protein
MPDAELKRKSDQATRFLESLRREFPDCVDSSFCGKRESFEAQATVEASSKPSTSQLRLCLKNSFCLKNAKRPIRFRFSGTLLLRENIPPQTVKESRRLFFHSFQFSIRHLALQSIPNCESSFQIGVAQERYRLLPR